MSTVTHGDAPVNRGSAFRPGNEEIVPQFDDLEPVRKAPTLFTLNTFGFKLYGKSDYDPESDSFMTTHYFVALFASVVLYAIATAGLH